MTLFWNICAWKCCGSIFFVILVTFFLFPFMVLQKILLLNRLKTSLRLMFTLPFTCKRSSEVLDLHEMQLKVQTWSFGDYAAYNFDNKRGLFLSVTVRAAETEMLSTTSDMNRSVCGRAQSIPVVYRWEGGTSLDTIMPQSKYQPANSDVRGRS